MDYAANRDNGLRVIAVGGNSLSRGLTLEGLSISYFLRNSQMYDTLLQMGRWFGYRDEYEDLCRIWLTEDAQHWYAHITEATTELRTEIRKMRNLKLTPQEFGLKVRAHPDALIVTARNKMRLAQIVERVISLSGQGLETPHLSASPEANRINSILTAELFQKLEKQNASSISPFGSATIVWSDIPKEIVGDFLRRFQVHPRNVTFQTEQLADFIDTTEIPSLSHWDIAVPGGDQDAISVEGLTVKPQRRSVTVDGDTVLVSGKSARVASRGAEREGMDPDEVAQITKAYLDTHPDKKNVPDLEFRRFRNRPLLLIHFVRPFIKSAEGSAEPLYPDRDPLKALGLSFPLFDDRGTERRVRYQVNLIEWRTLFAAEADEDDEEMENVGF